MMIGNILVVDDDIGVRDLVVRYLNTRGYQTSSAISGEEALTRLDQIGSFDLVITDFKMPGMNGLELARKSLMADPDRPVILMTAFAELDDTRQSASVGIYDFILKPFELVDFGTVVRRAINHRRLLMQSRGYQQSPVRLGTEMIDSNAIKVSAG